MTLRNTQHLYSLFEQGFEQLGGLAKYAGQGSISAQAAMGLDLAVQAVTSFAGMHGRPLGIRIANFLIVYDVLGSLIIVALL